MKFIEIINRYKKPILLFLFIETLLFALLRYDRQIRIDEHLLDLTNKLDAEYKVILNAFDEKAQIAFETLIDTPQVKEIMEQVSQADETQKRVLRQKLYATLKKKFLELQKFGFKQIHFHLPNNHSFLRMHKPEKFGDDLSNFRKTVVYVNETNHRISGFEEGIANDGYRFVFPLFDKNHYLGSVELSFSVYTLSGFLQSEFLDTRFIISKKALLSTDNDYIASAIDDRFVTDKNHREHPIPFSKNNRIKSYLSKNADHSFSLDEAVDDRTYIVTFIPVKNPVTLETNAYMVIFSQDKYLTQINSNFWILFSILSIVTMLLFLYNVKNRNFRKKIEIQNSELEVTNKRLKTILDSQDNMIIITDGTHMIDANAKVLAFFGFSSFIQFIKRHHCICDFFLRHKDYFHLGRVPKQQQWIEYIEKLPPQKRVVTMIGIDMEAKAFQINISKYGENGSSVITLHDVTDMLIQQKILQYKAMHDRLTDIYNRQKIDEVLDKICGYSCRRKEEIGVIMFDIDHFKRVNDKFGHDTGDEVLKKVAQLIKRNIREEDIFGRWGGEEFIVILRHTSIENTHKKAEMLRKAIEQMHHENIPAVTASFGVTKVTRNDTPQALMKRVDLALYKAKSEGRNRVVLSSFRKAQLVLS